MLKKKAKRADDLYKKDISNFFVCLVVLNPTSWSCFRFIEMFVVGLTVSLAIYRAIDLAISKTVWTERGVAINFSGLSLW